MAQKKEIPYYLLVRSADKPSQYTNSNVFSINLTKTFQNIKRIELLSASIPATYYNITNANNIIVFNEPGGTGLDITATLTNGAYNAVQLTAHIASVMTTASTGAVVYTSTSSTISQHFTITGSANNILKFSGAGTCRDVIGFEAVDTTSALTHTGTKAYALDTITQIFIDIAEFSQTISTSSTTGSSHTFVIPVNGTTGYTILYGDAGIYGIFQPYETLKYISTITMSLKDQTGKLLELNGAEWECLLKFVCE